MPPLIVFLFLALSADVTGWSKAHWGMSQSQVLEAFAGQATVQTGPAIERQFNEGSAVIGVDSVELGSTSYRVHFIMDPKTAGLRWILLQPLHKDYVDETEFSRLEALLSQKFGRPMRSDSPELKTSQWTGSATAISLKFTTIKAIGFHSLWLTYEDRTKLQDNL